MNAMTDTRWVVDFAEGSREMRDDFVTTEHLLLSLAGHNSAAGQILRDNGATRSAIEETVTAIRGSHRATTENAEDQYESLAKFGNDLTRAAVHSYCPQYGAIIGR